LSEAVKYYKMPADQGNANVQFNYGRCFENGKGVAKDWNGAVKYYKMSMDQGHAEARETYDRCMKKISESGSNRSSSSELIVDMKVA
jgi:TPR repeat protein